MIEISPLALEEPHPRVAVIGVGGAGGNVVVDMIADTMPNVTFVVANTDAQALNAPGGHRRIQLGIRTTAGLGAGSRPEIGKAAAEESLAEIEAVLEGMQICFIAAGMGGGTGTGAAPVIARAARSRNILTIGVVTRPFDFEGGRRARIAEAGIHRLAEEVDTLIVVPNQNLFRIVDRLTTVRSAFHFADQILREGVSGIVDLLTMPSLINLDLADLRFIMADRGRGMMGSGRASGEDRAIKAADQALSHPLLDGGLEGACGLVVSITGGDDLCLAEVGAAADHIRALLDPEAHIVLGSGVDPTMRRGEIRISIVATGLCAPATPRPIQAVQTARTAAPQAVICPALAVAEPVSTIAAGALADLSRGAVLFQRMAQAAGEAAGAALPAAAVLPDRGDDPDVYVRRPAARAVGA
jgi:cell division protein FtsZ